MMDRLRSLVGDDGEVATPYVRVSPHWDVERKRHLGYDASTTISVRSALDLAGKVAQAAMSEGDGRVDGPGFEVSREEALRDELLAGAVEAARGKAQRLAAAAERQLGRVVSVRERALDRDRGETLVTSMALADAMATEPEIVAADRTIAADVVVSFEFAD